MIELILGLYRKIHIHFIQKRYLCAAKLVHFNDNHPIISHKPHLYVALMIIVESI